MNLEKALFMSLLKCIRNHQELQNKLGERVWSMDYIGISMPRLNSEMTKQCKHMFKHDHQRFDMKRTYALAYKLKDKGLVRFKKYGGKYYTCLYLTDKGVEYVKSLKFNKCAYRAK